MARFSAAWGGAAAIMLLSLLLRLYKLADASVWSDEAYSLAMITYPVSAVWELSGLDVHPPLYYLILKGWVELVGSNSLVWVRALSVIFGLLTVGLGMWLMVLIATRRAAIVAGGLLAFLPIAVRYSQDVRMYSMLGALLLAATIALVYWVMRPSKKRYLIAYALLMLAGFYTHYFSIFAAVSHWLYLLLIRLPRFGGHRHIQRVDWWFINGMMAIMYIPWLPKILSRLSGAANSWIAPLSIDSVPSAIWRFLTGNDGHAHHTFIFWLLPLTYGIILLAVLAHEGGKYKFNKLVVIGAVFTIIAAAITSLSKPVFVERYLVFSALMMPLVMALAVDKIKNTAYMMGAVIFMLAAEVCGLNNIYSQQHTLNNPYRIADNQLARLMKYFDATSIPGDVLVAGNVHVFYLATYYETKGRRLVLYTPPTASGGSGRPNGVEFYAPMLKYTDDTYVDNLETLQSQTHRVWLLPFTYQFKYEGLKVPATWRLIRHEAGGDHVLNLYVICSPQAPERSEVCR